MTAARRIRAALSLSALLLAIGAPANAQLTLRAGRPAPGAIEALSAAGVALDNAAVVPWDRVARVDGPFAEQAEPFASIADRAWRARARLERGDLALSEPLFDALLLERLPGPTGAVVARGALRCRIVRGALASAVAPWIDALALREYPTMLDESSPLAGVMDPADLLAPLLPPIFLNDDSALLLIEQPIDTRDDALASALASLYVAAARAARAPDAATLPAIDPATLAQEPVPFVHAIVAAQIGSPAERADAVVSLRARITADLGSFREAWARVALARALARDEPTRREAVLHYLHLPARFARAQPYLTGVALAEASRLLELDADAEGARTLRNELAAAMPRHPALLWLSRASSPQANANAPAAGRATKERTP